MKAGRRHTYSMVARSEGMVATRERIVQAALTLLLEQAYDTVTLAAIAEAASVSHQTVLNHCASKENVEPRRRTCSAVRLKTCGINLEHEDHSMMARVDVV
jgi:AcrR family transcriptional regulator